MKNKNHIFAFFLIAMACAFFITCSNPIIEKWWQDDKEPEYIYSDLILKNIPIETIKILVEKEKVYETIFVDLPPEIIYETKYETKYIYEYIIEQLPPEIIYETIIEYEEKEVIVEVIKEIIKEVPVPQPPTEEEIYIYIKEHPDEIIKIIKEKETLYEYIKETIIKELTEEELKEIIKNIPPEIIIEYLTDEQIKYIVKQQPPEIILQSIQIIGIEYIIFSGDQIKYNEAAASGAASNLSQAEKDTNNLNVLAMAKALIEHSEYNMILHGHANPTKDPTDPGYNQDLQECIDISNTRAVNVAIELNNVYKNTPGGGSGIYPSSRVETSGYGGEKNLVSGSTLYAGLNRRVEMILFRLVTTKKIGN